MKEYQPECHDQGKLLYTEVRGKDEHWRFIKKMGKPWREVITQPHYFRMYHNSYFACNYAENSVKNN
jgi:hypothetical protein